MMQVALALEGHHNGPLFEHGRVRRGPLRPPGSTRMPGTVRRRVERQRTPAWADRLDIRDMYLLARALTKATGIRWSVDHIIPLVHPLVCGLHIATNMRVIPLDANVKKANSWGFTQLEIFE